MTARHPPRPTRRSRVRWSASAIVRQGFVHGANATAADAILSQATPRTPTVGLSSPSVSERIKRLEEVGVIQGYSVKINPKALGLPLAAWLRIRPIPGRLHKVAEMLLELPQIVECDRVTGEDCFMARAYVG